MVVDPWRRALSGEFSVVIAVQCVGRSWTEYFEFAEVEESLDVIEVEEFASGFQDGSGAGGDAVAGCVRQRFLTGEAVSDSGDHCDNHAVSEV